MPTKEEYQSNPEYHRQLARVSRARHHAKILAKAREQSRVPEVKMKKRNYRLKTIESYRAATKRWRDKNPEKLKASRIQSEMRRRTKMILNRTESCRINHLIESVKKKSRVRCYYCKRIIPTSEVNFDHVHPLHGGGEHLIQNIATSCGKCNSSKWAHPLTIWSPGNQPLLDL